jgi:prephenate dehydratase
MRAAYLGPAGTFTHEALRASARARGAEEVPYATEHDTILAVSAGDADLALVPIENSLEGGVRATLDTLVFDAPAVRIAGEEVLAVRHNLVAVPGAALADIDTVVSHPQALAQCRRFLRAELPGARLVAATSTADAVRDLAGSGRSATAAIGTRSAAELYGATVLRDAIQDEADNATRFIWIAAAGAVADDGETGPWKTSLVFHGAGDATPGWLVRCLSEFAFRGLNLTKIESRPLRRELGHYLFLVDLEGRETDAPVADAVASLRGHCEEVRVLGSYPAAS